MFGKSSKRARPIYIILIISTFFSLFLLVGCEPNPKDVAKAHETTVLADERAANLAQARNVKEVNDAIDLEIRNAKKAQVIQGWQRFIFAMSLIAIPLSGWVVFYAGRSLNSAMAGMSDALVLRAELSASLIHLDEDTRMFPLVMRPIHGDRYLIYDANTGASTVLDASVPLDRQLVATSGAVKLAGVVAREARRAESSDSTGVALSANVPIVELTEKDGVVVVGQDIKSLAEVAYA